MNFKTGDHRFAAVMVRDSKPTFPDRDINNPIEVYGPWRVEVEEIVIGRVTATRVMYGFPGSEKSKWMEPWSGGYSATTREEAIEQMKAGCRSKVEAAREAVKRAEEIASAAEMVS